MGVLCFDKYVFNMLLLRSFWLSFIINDNKNELFIFLSVRNLALARFRSFQRFAVTLKNLS